MPNKYPTLSKIDELVELFFHDLYINEEFRNDTRWHANNAQELNTKVFKNIDNLDPEELKNLIWDNKAMMRPRPTHRDEIFNEIDNAFSKVKIYLTLIKNFAGDVKVIDELLDHNNSLNIKGAGLFFITHLLAGAHLNQYVVFHDSIYAALQELDILHIGNKVHNGSQYICVNAICKWLYEE